MYISSCLFSLMSSGLLVIPGVSCLDVLSCPALMSLLNIIIWVYILVRVFLFLPCVCTVTESLVSRIFLLYLRSYQDLFLSNFANSMTKWFNLVYLEYLNRCNEISPTTKTIGHFITKMFKNNSYYFYHKMLLNTVYYLRCGNDTVVAKWHKCPVMHVC